MISILLEQRMDKAIVFFLPVNTRPKEYPPLPSPMNRHKFWHTGIIYKDKVYETFNKDRYSVKPLSDRLPELKDAEAVYVDHVILPEKLKEHIKSGTSCGQFVLRTIGKSDLKGSDKGEYYPQDVYNMIK